MMEDQETEQTSESLAKNGGGYELGSMRPDQPLPVLGNVSSDNGDDLVGAVGAELARRAQIQVDRQGGLGVAQHPQKKRGLWKNIRSWGEAISPFAPSDLNR